MTGLLIFLPKALPRPELRFDWTGFTALAMGVHHTAPCFARLRHIAAIAVPRRWPGCGVSVTSLMLVRNTQVSRADIAAGITPFDRVLQGGDYPSRMLDPATRHGAAALDQMIKHQAQIIAFNDDFSMMTFVVVPLLLLLLVMRGHERPVAAPATGD